MIHAGTDGTCPCGMCHVPGYREMVDAVDAHAAIPCVAVHDDVVVVANYKPSNRELEHVFSTNMVTRGAFAIMVTHGLAQKGSEDA